MGRDGLLTLEKPDEMVNYCHDGECRGFHGWEQQSILCGESMLRKTGFEEPAGVRR
jgi:hypothetical protein